MHTLKINMVHLQITHLEGKMIFQTSMILFQPLIFSGGVYVPQEGSFDFEDLPFSPELRHLLEYVEVSKSTTRGGNHVGQRRNTMEPHPGWN